MGRRLECNFFYPLSGSETFKVLYLVQQTAIIFEKKNTKHLTLEKVTRLLSFAERQSGTTYCLNFL